MDTNVNTRIKVSFLWVIVMFNMVFADVLGLFIPGIQEQVAQFAGDTPIPFIMLIAAIVHQIPIFMIFLSYVLQRKMNRRLNIFASIITIIYVIGGGSLLPHYIFIASIEVGVLVYIMWIMYKWKNTEESL